MTPMDVSEAIRTKRAVREYRDEPLPDPVVRAILHAGRRAQSSKNDQPWHFVAIRDRAVLEALGATSPNVGHIARSALTVAIVTPHPERKQTILFDAGQAAANMQLAAWERGVVSCLATIYEGGKARGVLGFPSDRDLHIAIAFGYPLPGDAEPRVGRRGGRRTLDEVVRWDRW
jgi:nitroreductase